MSHVAHLAVLLALFAACPAIAAEEKTPSTAASSAGGEGPEVDLDGLAKLTDDILWHQELDSIAEVRTFRYTGQPARGARNPLILYAYSFIPRNLDRTRKSPLVVLIHGGVHSNHMTGGPANAANIVRELIERGYTVVAPDYRGSTGYGEPYKRAIDYGGKENDDVHAAREWMLQRYRFLDPARVGLVGWSHGGMIALFNIFDHPDAYACAYAGSPVSDLIERRKYLKTMSQTMADSAGDAASKDDEEYRRRSALAHVAKLGKPLLIQATTSDSTVRIAEVEHLIAALQAAGRTFEYKIYPNAPGGHHFNRIDTALAVESRSEMYSFLKRHLKP